MSHPTYTRVAVQLVLPGFGNLVVPFALWEIDGKLKKQSLVPPSRAILKSRRCQ